MNLEKNLWQGQEIIVFEAGGYEAKIIPSVGANVISLKHLEKNVDILRSPKNIESFKESPQSYGLPLLFPPNRIEDGTYTACGKVYKFPINEPNKNNHIHGFIRTLPFNVTKLNKGEDCVEIELNFVSDENNNAIYDYFPHQFECILNYNLSKDGLKQKVTFINNSDSKMPLGVGFHTAFNVPFNSNSKREDYRLLLSVDKRWELSDRNLPTGEIVPLNEMEQKYRTEGMMPFSFALDTPYSAKNIELEGKEFNGAVIVDTANDIKVVYEADKQYKYWTVWNCGGDKDFLCPEPQTWVINAPNLDMEDEVTGFRMLDSKDSFTAESRIYVHR